MTLLFSQDIQVYCANQLFNQQLTFILSTSGALGELNHAIDAAITEVVGGVAPGGASGSGNGYQRVQYTPPQLTLAANYDQTNKRVIVPSFTVTFTASSGNSIQFSSLVVLIGGDANSSQVISSVVAGTTNTITVPVAMTAGQLLGFTADTGGTLPSGLTADTLYQVLGGGGTTFQVGTPGNTSAISLGSVGSGTLRSRYSNGTILGVDTSMGTTTIPAGTPYNFTVNLYNMNNGTFIGS